jgi:hypothetical protein
VPRTERPQARRIRYCGDCGYELSRENDGTCPMCPRLDQIRSDFIVPRPSDMAAHRARIDRQGSAGPGTWPPTVAEYRAILAERGVTGRVVKNPRLMAATRPDPTFAPTTEADALSATPPETPARRKAKRRRRARDPGGPSGQTSWGAGPEADTVPNRRSSSTMEQPSPTSSTSPATATPSSTPESSEGVSPDTVGIDDKIGGMGMQSVDTAASLRAWEGSSRPSVRLAPRSGGRKFDLGDVATGEVLLLGAIAGISGVAGVLVAVLLAGL